MLKALCMLNGTSGDETAVREYIIDQVKDYAPYEIDALGSVIVRKKGRKTPAKSVAFHAHMDEVGFIITGITDEGYLRFSAVGSIDAGVCLDRVVCIGSKRVMGVIGDKAAHQLEKEECEKLPSFDKLLIDIGATSKEEAQKAVRLGDFAYFTGDYYEFGSGFVKAKALDDRIGCMLMLELIHSELEYDTVFCFNTQEEVGLRGAKCTSYAVQSDIAVILEATTAADFDGVAGCDRVCVCGNGPVISFMDRRTIYDKALYELAMDTAMKNGIPAQTKTAIAGGNDAGSVQRSGRGSRVLAISLPCRYIHSSSSVVKLEDIENTRRLLNALIPQLYD